MRVYNVRRALICGHGAARRNAMSVNLTYINRVPVANLQPGMAVVNGGRVLHLEARVAHVCGYDHWTYRRLEPNGTAVGSETRLRRDGKAEVLWEITPVS
jgi:hypothetical protein